MEKKVKQKRKERNGAPRNVLQLLLVGAVTGVFAGGVVTLFNILAVKGEAFSRDAYAFVRANPAFIPLLLLVLALGAFFIGVAVQISSVIRGCGIPQAEGGARGIVRFRWFRDATAMFASCLISIFMGLSIGAEGPSVLIGACVGDGVSYCLRRNEMIRRYQVTGGACTGLAVAGNVPLTGIIFAFEEAHKHFMPEVFICSFISVIFGLLTRSAIYGVFQMQIQSSFHSYIFQEMAFVDYGFVFCAGIVCGLLGVLFTKSCFKMRDLFKKIKFRDPKWTLTARIAIAVFLGGAVSLVETGVMGGGHELIESLGTYGGTASVRTESVFGLPLAWTLLIVFVLRFMITGVNVGSGIPCGIFIPVIAIGACIGGLLNCLWVGLGMNATYCDLMIMICLAAFFTTIVRAPLTSIIMICELTGSFAPLLPVVIAVSVGYIIGEISRTDGIYETLLEIYERESGIHERAVRERFVLVLYSGSIADKREIRDVLWPSGTRVVEIARGEETILPDGSTQLHAGDVLTIVCKTTDAAKTRDELVHILG